MYHHDDWAGAAAIAAMDSWVVFVVVAALPEAACMLGMHTDTADTCTLPCYCVHPTYQLSVVLAFQSTYGSTHFKSLGYVKFT